ncbi:hypothetical protein [Caulobacter sp.]|uniref:hypothetical protein n=1 Tax=Caulobacter sp. TaxID=78 RepID=UPI003BAEDCEF
MSDPVVFEADYIIVKFGDGELVEQFEHDCMINLSRSVSITKSMVEETLYDCTDPTKPGTIYRLVDSVSLEVTGSGKTHTASLLTWLNWSLSSASKNVAIELGKTGGAVIRTAMHLSQFQPAGGDPKKYAEAAITLQSTGPITVAAL